MDNLEVLEFKRKLGRNKDKFKNDLVWVCNLFNVDEKGYLNRYEKVSEDMIEKYIELDKLKREMNDLNYMFEKMKYDFIVENNIDIKEKLKDRKNGSGLVDELYKLGFISSDYFSIMKEYFWNKRNKMSYKFSEWM